MITLAASMAWAMAGVTLPCALPDTRNSEIHHRCYIDSGQHHRYEIPPTWDAGWLVIEQQGVDVIVTTERGSQSTRSQAVGGRVGWEVVAVDPGDSTVLSPRAASGANGSYTIRYLSHATYSDWSVALNALETGGTEFVNGNFATAGDAYKAASLEWAARGMERMQAVAQYQVAVVSQAQNNHELAREHFLDSAASFAAMGDRSNLARSLNGAGLAWLRSKYDLEEAERLFEAATNHAEAAGDEYAVAVATSNSCVVQQDRGALREAGECYRRVIRYLERIGERNETHLTLARLATVQAALGDLVGAQESLAAAINAARADSDSLAEARIRLELSTVEGVMGEYERAIAEAREARDAIQKRHGYAAAAEANLTLGNHYENIGAQERARTHYLLALGAARQVGTARVIAEASFLLGRVTDASPYALELIDEGLFTLRASNPEGGNPILIARMSLAKVRKLIELDRLAEAVDLAKLTIREVERLDVPTVSADAYMARGELLLALERSAVNDLSVLETESESRSASQFDCVGAEAGRAACVDFWHARSLFGDHLHRSMIAEAETGLAWSALLEGDVRRATSFAMSAIEMLAETRDSLTVPEFRSSYIAKHRAAYEVLVRASSVLQSGGELALEYVEEFRASTRFVLAEGRVSDEIAADDVLRLKQVSLAIARHGSGGGDEQLHSLDTFLRVQEEFDDASRTVQPDVAAPFGVRRFRERIKETEALLAFFMGTDRAYAWWVFHDQVRMLDLGPFRAFEAKVHSLHALLRQSPFSFRGGDRTDALLKSVALELIWPVERYLAEIENVIVVPDGATWRLPFAALPLSTIEEPLVSLVSLSVRSQIAPEVARRRLSPTSVLIVTDPKYSPTGRTSVVDQQTNWVSLPGSAEEAEILASHITSARFHHLTGAYASRDRLLDLRRSDDFDIVHIAAHGMTHPQLPLLSGFALAAYDEGDQALGSFVSAKELGGVGNGRNLVVLSGCETAVGRTIYGSGQYGISRAFLEGGAAATLSTLWSIEDGAAIEFTDNFYEAIAEGKALPEAVRQGQLALMGSRRFNSPHYWAPYVQQSRIETDTIGPRRSR